MIKVHLSWSLHMNDRRLHTSFLSILLTLLPVLVHAQTLRIVTYNTANDVSGNNTVDYLPRTGMSNVLQAIAALNVAGNARPIDILALQESVYYTGSGINPTAQGFVNLLNSVYGSGAYAAATVNGTTDGNSIGNGPQTLVYRISTVQLIGQQALGTPSGSGIPRQVMLYQFQPVGYSASSSFYLFNNHYKSGTTSSDDNRRGIESALVASTANSLPANTPIIFAGDYNPTNNTTDQGYQGVIAGTGTHNNHGIDPLNPSNVAQNWSTSALKNMETESPSTSSAFTNQSTGGMHYRDDMLLHSPAVANGIGIKYIANSYVSFGNTNTHTYLGDITTGSASAFAAELLGYNSSQAATVLSDLSNVSDHLPVVADYFIVAVPEPASWAFIGVLAVASLGAAYRFLFLRYSDPLISDDLNACE